MKNLIKETKENLKIRGVATLVLFFLALLAHVLIRKFSLNTEFLRATREAGLIVGGIMTLTLFVELLVYFKFKLEEKEEGGKS